MDSVKDTVVPGGKWAFDEEVTRAFDDMFARSIPDYEVMRKACLDIGARYVKPKTDVVDLGCSRGGALAPLIEKFGAYNHFVGVEVSPQMVEACRQRFEGMVKCGIVDIRQEDLRTYYPAVSASLTMAVMTLQFTPIEYRQRIIQKVYDTTAPGGAFIFAEKILGRDDSMNRLMVETYYDMKKAHGYTQDDIDRKRLSLEGVLVPVTAAWNEDMLKSAGFRHVECFWRLFNFTAWVAVK